MKHTQGKCERCKKEVETADHLTFYGLCGDCNERAWRASPSYLKDENKANANLIASAPEMLELLKDILAEVRPEISRVNEAAGRTIFNPVATETIDMAKEIIAKAEGE